MTILLTLLTIHILGLMSPGPDFAMVMKNALTYGRRDGIATCHENNGHVVDHSRYRDTATMIYAWISLLCMIAAMYVNAPLSKALGYVKTTLLTAGLGGVFFVVSIIPNSLTYFIVFISIGAPLGTIGLANCTALLSSMVDENNQGRVLGNNQALQVGGEAISGMLGGLIAAVSISLSLIVMGVVAIVAALFVYRRRDVERAA